MLRKKAGIIVDMYDDTFQFSELKNRPKNNVASSGSIELAKIFSKTGFYYAPSEKKLLT